MEQVITEYYTPNLPPPHTFFLKSLITSEGKGVSVSVEQIFINREEVSEKIIQEEGYTGDDDFKWTGFLNEIWKEDLNNLLENTTLINDERYILISSGKAEDFKSPDDIETWEKILNELLQAAYEAAGREAPLQIGFTEKGNEVLVNISFAERQCEVIKGEDSKKFSWKAADEFMQKIFSFSFWNRPEKRNPATYVVWNGEKYAVDETEKQQLEKLFAF